MRAMPLLRLLAVLLVAASWANLLTTYAVHYARLHASEDSGFEFPDDGWRTHAIIGREVYTAR